MKHLAQLIRRLLIIPAEVDGGEVLSRTLPEFSIGKELGDDAVQEASAAIRGAHASLLTRQ